MFPKIIVMAIAGGSEKYILLEKACRETWAFKPPEGVEIVFVKGRSAFLENKLYSIAERLSAGYGINPLHDPVSRVLAKIYSRAPVSLHCDQCTVTVPDSRFLLSIKTIRAMAFCLERFDFDYLFRTNLGSYVHIERLRHYLSQQVREKFYCSKRGVHTNAGQFQGVVFGSGAGYALSRDLVQALVDRQSLIIREQLEHHGKVLDDVQFGYQLISRMKIPLVEKKRQDIDVLALEAAQIIPDPDCYHFYFTGNKDFKAQHQLHKLLNDLGQL